MGRLLDIGLGHLIIAGSCREMLRLRRWYDDTRKKRAPSEEITGVTHAHFSS